MRHPAGVCLHWKKGQCNKGDMCFYHHPDAEFGIMQQDPRSPALKRRRTFSNPSSPNQPTGSSENAFLYQKFLEVSKELEMEKSRNAGLQIDQTPRSTNHIAQNPTMHFPRQNVTMISRPTNMTGYYAIHPSGSVAGQAHPKDSFPGQAHPNSGMAVPMSGWAGQTGTSMQWGTGQDFFPTNQ